MVERRVKSPFSGYGDEVSVGEIGFGIITQLRREKTYQ